MAVIEVSFEIQKSINTNIIGHSAGWSLLFLFNHKRGGFDVEALSKEEDIAEESKT